MGTGGARDWCLKTASQHLESEQATVGADLLVIWEHSQFFDKNGPEKVSSLGHTPFQ